ncbi:hypothetical protein LOS03_12615 [Proteus mirabilis]|uniref:hypothetical protein n=1 Tax=Proteus mirabilis TaxID=584 RepID=UPI001E3D5DD4|nr:hypothetical protein [Proteus mirabilis]MCD4613256.1 hypothetical protein [Proteus mirabilis]
MTQRAEVIRKILRNGSESARQLANIMNISQLTLSRVLKMLSNDIVQIGSGRSIHLSIH